MGGLAGAKGLVPYGVGESCSGLGAASAADAEPRTSAAPSASAVDLEMDVFCCRRAPGAMSLRDMNVSCFLDCPQKVYVPVAQVL
jgi:hypothetical protein